MGKNKNPWLQAISEMRYFLAGAALVLVLVTVAPVLAQFGGGPPGGGGGGGGGRGSSGGRESGAASGGAIPKFDSGSDAGTRGTADLDRPKLEFTKPRESGVGNQSGIGSKLESGTKLFPGGGKTEGQFPGKGKGVESGFSGQGYGLQYAGDKEGTKKQPESYTRPGEGMKQEQGQTQKWMQKDSGFGKDFMKSTQRSQMQKLDAAQFIRSYDKGLGTVAKRQAALEKRADSQIAKVQALFEKAQALLEDVDSAETETEAASAERKALSAERKALQAEASVMKSIVKETKYLGQACRFTSLPPRLPMEVELDEEFDCQDYLDTVMESLEEQMDAEEKDIKAAFAVVTDAYDELTNQITAIKTAIETAVDAFNAEMEAAQPTEEEGTIIEEEEGGGYGIY